MALRIINTLLIFLALFATACGQKKCQQPATEKFQTIVDQPWRLVETTDTDENYQALSNTTFLVFEFTKDYKGSVKKVLNNAEYDTPVYTFLYNIDPDSQIIRAQFANPTGDEASSSSTETKSTTKSTGSIVDYDYDLGRELTLVDSKRGFYYRFVPYQGIIAPDDKCKF